MLFVNNFMANRILMEIFQPIGSVLTKRDSIERRSDAFIRVVARVFIPCTGVEDHLTRSHGLTHAQTRSVGIGRVLLAVFRGRGPLIPVPRVNSLSDPWDLRPLTCLKKNRKVPPLRSSSDGEKRPLHVERVVLIPI